MKPSRRRQQITRLLEQHGARLIHQPRNHRHPYRVCLPDGSEMPCATLGQVLVLAQGLRGDR